jgi:hypothetical protein
MSPLEASVPIPAVFDSFTRTANQSTSKRNTSQIDSAEPLDSHSMNRSPIEKRVISPFDHMMSTPMPSSLLAGPKQDGALKRKMPEPEEDSAELLDILPKKRARVGQSDITPRQASADVPVVSATLVGTDIKEEISELDMGQSHVVFFSVFITDVAPITDIIITSGPSTPSASTQAQSRKRKASELGAFNLAFDTPPRRKVARTATMYRLPTRASLGTPQAPATRIKQEDYTSQCSRVNCIQHDDY